MHSSHGSTEVSSMRLWSVRFNQPPDNTAHITLFDRIASLDFGPYAGDVVKWVALCLASGTDCRRIAADGQPEVERTIKNPNPKHHTLGSTTFFSAQSY